MDKKRQRHLQTMRRRNNNGTEYVLAAVGLFAFGYTTVLAAQAVLRGACGTADLTAGSSTAMTDAPPTPHI